MWTKGKVQCVKSLERKITWRLKPRCDVKADTFYIIVNDAHQTASYTE